MLVVNLVYFASALVVTLLFVLFAIKFSARHKLYDSIDERKIHTGEISRLGGFGIMVPFLLIGLYCFYRFYIRGFCSIHELSVWGLFVCTLIIYVSGTIDDLVDLNPWLKLSLQIVAILFAYGFFAVAFKDEDFSILNFSFKSLFVFGITFIFFVGCINAYNLIDGSDMLCSSVSIYSIFTLGYFLRTYNPVYFTLSIIVCAGLLGFMWFNKPDAKIFMGDGGSQSLGVIIAFMSLLVISQSQSLLLSHLICMNLVAVPCIDTIAAIWRRLRQHVGIFHADRFHMHHKLYALGFKKWGIVGLITLIQVFVCGSAILSWQLRIEHYIASILIQCFVFVCIVIYFAIIHYKAHSVVDVK